MILARDITYVDFETEAIAPRPDYPPEPVGVAILEPGKDATYYAWGHPTGNNCSKDQAHQILRKLWEDAMGMRRTLGFYNAKFDLCVARERLGLDLPPATQVDDALILAVLKDPRKLNHQLKPLAKEWLGIDPVERDELQAWILANVPEVGRKKSSWGAYISRAPGDLVGKYACMDVKLTREMREHLHDQAVSMEQAYTRERRLLPVLLGMEARGVPIAIEHLEADYDRYTKTLERLDSEIRTYMELPESASLDGDEFAERLTQFGSDSVGWPRTANGKPSTAQETLDLVLADRDLYGALQYRGILAHSLSTFMAPWLGKSVAGRFHVSWNALKGEKGLGAGTGRLSSNPNLQNIITEENCERADKDRPDTYPELPRLRRYIAPAKGRCLVGRDFNQQEYRVFAHYEDGSLAQGYREDPWMDIHKFVMKMLNDMAGLTLERKETKTLNFGMLYGMGKQKMAVKIKRDLDMTKHIIDTYLATFPGIRAMRDQMDQFDKLGQPIQTLGGRIYYAEEPKIIDGSFRRFGYKLVNLLCQASSADITKEAMIRFDEYCPDRLCLSIHDELVAEVGEQERDAVMIFLRAAMEENVLAGALDVPLPSEGYWGYNLQDLTDLPKGQ